MSIRIKSKGSWDKTTTYLKHAKNFDPTPVLKHYGEIGVDALSSSTPVDTGLAAASWYYEIEKTKNGYVLTWNNSDIEGGFNIALLIQYGHGTKSGTYVQGVDYINPALAEVFNNISVQIWREVSE